MKASILSPYSLIMKFQIHADPELHYVHLCFLDSASHCPSDLGLELIHFNKGYHQPRPLSSHQHGFVSIDSFLFESSKLIPLTEISHALLPMVSVQLSLRSLNSPYDILLYDES